MKMIYVASPYSKGDVAINVRNQMIVGDILIDLGYLPYLPLLWHFQHMFYPKEYRKWLEMDLAAIERCDALIRLPGQSPGADEEVAHAIKCDVKVVLAGPNWNRSEHIHSILYQGDI
jgi:hypothetical protein